MKMNPEISSIANTLKNASSAPSLVSATIIPNPDDNLLSILSTWKIKDLVKMESGSYSRDYTLTKDGSNIFSTGISYDVNDSSVISAFSKSGKKRAVVTEKKSPYGLYMELWNGSKKEHTIDLSENKDHGKITANDHFGCLKWSSNEKYLLYTAEAKVPKSVSFFKDLPSTKDDKEKTVQGEEFIFKEEWGEQLVGSHHFSLCIVNVATGEIEVLPIDKVESEISVGKAIWGQNDEIIVFEGWFESPHRLGLKHCFNRRSAIFSINLETKDIECLTIKENCVHCPNFSPDFKSLVYLENAGYGPHLMCSRICKYDWTTKSSSIVVDVVNNPIGEEFPGIYGVHLPPKMWSSDGKHIFLSTFWRSYQVVICVNIETGHVQKINFDEDFGCCVVHCIHNNLILAEVSSVNIEPSLMIGFINICDKVTVNWRFLDVPVKHFDISWEVIKLKPSAVNETYDELDFEIILLKPEETIGKLPLIVMPHGGPHSTYSPMFSHFRLALLKLHFMVCLVNYRGSLGFGETNVKSLPGNVGIQDVMDVQDAASYIKEKYKSNIGDVFYFGGSHGGFLGAHVAGQFLEFYKAIVLVNPVTDISAMCGSTDIPDWCLVEAGYTERYDYSKVVNHEQLKCMWEHSPIRHAEKIKTPILLLVGKNDLRVPPSQGIKFYQLLKARNVPTKLYLYEDNHTLGKIPHESDVFMQTVLWCRKYSTEFEFERNQ